MSKEGLGVIVPIFLFALVLTTGSWISSNNFLLMATLFCWGLVGLSCYFFRDPERKIPPDEDLIVAPADGKIIAIEKEYEPLFFKQTVTRLSIFLSVLDVHINRIPISGKVIYFNYIRGRFHPAFKQLASTENEQTIIAIENEHCKVLFKQIAGILARRIICHIREGSRVTKGERFGIIKFGSRVDIFLPENVQLTIQLNDVVKGGETIIGKIIEK